jgi:natural product biosynthesis luciferase-like monooxygenase protein
MFRGIETIRRLWAGETLAVEGPEGRPVEVRLLPRPVQKELPVWVTTAGSLGTWERAGSIGANVLAALVGYGPEDLADRVGRYRRAREAAGHDPAAGIVTLVAHTYVGTDDGAVREQVREPMTHYLQSYLGQFRNLGLEEAGATERDARDVASLAFEHYFESATLLGTQNKCARALDALSSAGADEVACLVDFGLDTDTVLEALPRLAALREHYAQAGTEGAELDPAGDAGVGTGTVPGGAAAEAAARGGEKA